MACPAFLGFSVQCIVLGVFGVAVGIGGLDAVAADVVVVAGLAPVGAVFCHLLVEAVVFVGGGAIGGDDSGSVAVEVVFIGGFAA